MEVDGAHIRLDRKTDQIFITNALVKSVTQDRLGRVYIKIK